MSGGFLSLLQSAAFSDLRLKPMDLRLLGKLASYTNTDGLCWPRQAVLAEEMRVSERSIKRSIANLKATGYLVATPRYGKDGAQLSSVYFIDRNPKIDLDATVSDDDAPTTSSTPGDTPVTPGVTPRVTPGVTPRVTPSKNKTIITKPIEQDSSVSLRAPDAGGDQALDVDPAPQPAPAPAEPPMAMRAMASNRTPAPPANTQASDPVQANPPANPKPEPAAPRTARPDLQAAFAELWDLWPIEGRRRSKARPKCLAALGRAAKDRAPAELVAAARAWLKSQRDPRFCPALDRWLDHGKWEHFLPSPDMFAASEAARARAADPEAARMAELRKRFAQFKLNRLWKSAWDDHPETFPAPYPEALYVEFGMPLPTPENPADRDRVLAHLEATLKAVKGA